MSALARATVAAAVPATPTAAPVGTGSITIVNLSHADVHPWFKCCSWDGVDVPRSDEWTFFGGILRGTQFTWPEFHTLLDPHCKNPVIKFTFTQYGDPPLEKAAKGKVVSIRHDRTVDYRIELGSDIVIKDIEPDADDE